MSHLQRSEHHERLTRWVRDHGSAVRGYLGAMVRKSDVADDLLQEVFRRAWQARERYQEAGTPKAYLLKIADRLVYDRSRKSGREVNFESETWEQIQPTGRDGDPSDNLNNEETQRQLAAALDTLSPPQRRALLLRYYGDMSFAEIAKAMDCPLNTALSHCHRGLAALKKQFVADLE